MLRFLTFIFILFASSMVWSQAASITENRPEVTPPMATPQVKNLTVKDISDEELKILQELDQNAPIIETVVVASANTTSPPIVSAVLSDDRSGISLAEIHWRQRNTDTWRTTPLTANHNGLFMAMLPQELAATGFDYFVVAFDAAGNGPTQYASQTEPKTINASIENTRQRIRRTEVQVNESEGISSGWLMFNVMLCILTSGTSIFFWADYLEIEERKVNAGNDEAYLKELNNAQVNDAFIGGVSALAGIVTLSTTSYLLTQPIKE